ncbi:MAG: superoxide dismutase [Planctomycetaceae bacterium]|nr:superoxide dismutase [Planctomycetaceae bacterium]
MPIAIYGWGTQPDSVSTSLDRIAHVVGASVASHCEIPCGIYDDHAMVQRMLLDAETISKASAQIQLLSGKIDAESLNTISRWVLVKEEHSRELQHNNAWYFVTQRVKAVPAADPGYQQYLQKLAAHHAISVNAMKAAQSLDPEVQKRLSDSIKAVSAWYPPNPAGADANGTETWRALQGR